MSDRAEDAAQRAAAEKLRDAPQAAAHRRMLLPALLVLFPPVLFYAVLMRTSVNLPNLDDYDAVLGFLNQQAVLKSTAEKVSLLLSFQQGEFKLIFLRGLAWLQVGVTGHLNFAVLSAISNASVLLLGFLLWKMFLPAHRDPAVRVALFAPVSWLLFQLQYWETLNFATPGLQHIVELLFAFGTFYLLTRAERWAYCAALAGLTLAVSADGNGLLVIPIGALMLIVARRFRGLAGWVLVSAVCMVVYAYHYNVMSSSSDAHRSVLSVILQFKPLFVFGLMGSAASMSLFVTPSIVLGVLISVFLLVMVLRGYARRNPLVSYCVLFLLLTVAGAAGLRADFGFMQVLASRYALYSALLLVFAWIAIAEAFLQHRPGRLMDSGLYLGAMVLVVVFSLSMDMAGANALIGRRNALTEAMAAFEHAGATESSPSPAPKISFPGEHDPATSFNGRARTDLIESMRLGIYQPPRF